MFTIYILFQLKNCYTLSKQTSITLFHFNLLQKKAEEIPGLKCAPLNRPTEHINTYRAAPSNSDTASCVLIVCKYEKIPKIVEILIETIKFSRHI